MNRTFVIGDIHGAHKALEQCLERCGFNKETDTLITLGDICDGWAYVKECVDILLTIPNRVDIIGNHDEWFHRWLKTGRHPDNWYQGGKGTYRSYFQAARGKELDGFDRWERDDDGVPIRRLPGLLIDEIPDAHKQFFENQIWYYKDEKNRLFVHGGFLKEYTLEENLERRRDDDYFHWNRELWYQALSVSDDSKPLTFVEKFSEIFIGHTATINWTQFKKAKDSYVLLPTQNDDCPPMHADIVWNLDTGAGSTGRLTIMDIDTHDYWQSDLVNTFYGDYKPRG